jgi:hypothetical protein
MSSIGASHAIVRRAATCRSRAGGSDTTKRPWRARFITAASVDAADPESVANLGEWYLDCPSAHRDPRVVQAYRLLQEQTDILFAITTRGMGGPQSVRIVFTRCRRPYETDEELLAAVALSGTLEITSAATVNERLHPLLDCNFGGGFDRFRAVHDLIGHFWCGYGFQITDELAAWQVQDHMHHGLARLALANELCGVNAARCIVGEAPDLKALLLVPLRGSLEQEIA